MANIGQRQTSQSIFEKDEIFHQYDKIFLLKNNISNLLIYSPAKVIFSPSISGKVVFFALIFSGETNSFGKDIFYLPKEDNFSSHDNFNRLRLDLTWRRCSSVHGTVPSSWGWKGCQGWSSKLKTQTDKVSHPQDNFSLMFQFLFLFLFTIWFPWKTKRATKYQANNSNLSNDLDYRKCTDLLCKLPITFQFHNKCLGNFNDSIKITIYLVFISCLFDGDEVVLIFWSTTSRCCCEKQKIYERSEGTRI